MGEGSLRKVLGNAHSSGYRMQAAPASFLLPGAPPWELVLCTVTVAVTAAAFQHNFLECPLVGGAKRSPQAAVCSACSALQALTQLIMTLEKLDPIPEIWGTSFGLHIWLFFHT